MFLRRQGKEVSALALAGALTAHAVEAAPDGLADAAAKIALAQAGVPVASLPLTVQATLPVLAWLHWRPIVVRTAAGVLSVGAVLLVAAGLTAPKPPLVQPANPALAQAGTPGQPLPLDAAARQGFAPQAMLPRPEPPPGFDYPPLLAVRYADGTWLAVGGDTSLLPSANGTNWTDNHLGHLGVSLAFNDACYDKGRWTAVGYHRAIASSIDARSWTLCNLKSNEHLWRVSSGPDAWVAVGMRGCLMTSRDGTNWVERTSGTTDLRGVGFGAGRWVVVGYGGTVWASTNATDWSRQNAGVAVNFEAVQFANGIWVAVGAGNVIITSPDGVLWETSRSSPMEPTLLDVCHDNGLWVAVGFGGAVLTSPDASTWTGRPSETTTFLNRVRHLGGKWIGVGGNGAIVTSPDGISWTPQSSQTSKKLFDVAYANGRWVAVGYSATIVSSEDSTNWTARDSGIRRLIPLPRTPQAVRFKDSNDISK